MFLLELLDGLYILYLIFVAGPRAVARWIRRLSRPTGSQLAVSQTPEVQRFRRNARLVCIGWLVLSLIGGMAGGSPWMGLIVLAIGLMIIPPQIETRYDRLVARLGDRRPPTLTLPRRGE